MASIRASIRGLEIVDKARKGMGWTRVQTSSWWREATTSQATLKRFWRRIPIEKETFVRICQIVGVINWLEIVDKEAEIDQLPINDLVEAPYVSTFYGRIQEQNTLQYWITSDRCRLLGLLGMGGVGKSALAAKLVETIQSDFESLIWRSLRYAPPFAEIVTDLLQFLSGNSGDVLDNDVEAMLAQLLRYLHEHRCLLVLDDFDTVLKGANLAGCYCEGYEAYGEFIGRVAHERHQSCLLLISSEKPQEISYLEERNLFVRSLKLKGLDNETAKHILREKGFFNLENDWEEIIETYKGNPLALKIVATTIQELFNGNVSEFLREGTYIFGDIFTLLEQQFNRLSDIEKQIVNWLARNQEWDSLAELREQLVPAVSKRELLEALDSLQRRSLFEKSIGMTPFTLQPIIMKYVLRYS